jgi:PAS domain S-box-containing protein
VTVRHRPVWLKLLPWVPALVALLLLAVMGLSLQFVVGDALQARAVASVEQAATRYADTVSRVVGRGAAQLSGLARAGALQAGSTPASMRAELEHLRDSLPALVWIGVTDVDGRVLAATQGLLEGQSIADRPVFVQGRQGPWFGGLHAAVALAPAYLQRGQAAPSELADLALPLLDEQRRLRGVLVAHLDSAYLEALRQQVLGPPSEHQAVSLALVDSGDSLVMGDLPGDVLPALSAAPQHASTPNAQAAGRGWSTRDLVLARVPLPQPDMGLKLDWQVVAAQPLAAALAPVAALQQQLLLGGLALALALGVLGAAVSRWLARPAAEMLEELSARLGDAAPAGDGRAPNLLNAMTASFERLRAVGAERSPGERLLVQVLRDASRLQSTLLQMPAPVYLLDDRFRVVFWNHAAEQVFACPADYALGQPAAGLLPGSGLETDGQNLAHRIPLEPGPWHFEASVCRPGASPVRGQWRLSKVLGEDGRFVGVLAQVLDRSAEHAAEQRVSEHRETLVAIIHSASDAVISTDAEGVIELFNPAAERIFGHRADDMLGRTLDVLLPEAERAGHHTHLSTFADSAVTRRRMGTGRVLGRHVLGHRLELEASISQARVAGRVVLTAILRDVTERVQAERALMQMQFELSDLTQRLLVQEQTMMRRMAQTLHDRLGQTLTALRLTLEAAPRSTTDSVHQRAVLLTEQAVTEVRQALVEWRPPLLEDQGLAPALASDLRTRETEIPGIDLLLEAGAGAETRWPPEVEYAAFMVAREAVVNAQQHADATLVRVLLSGDEHLLQLEVVDDGRGLPEGGAAASPGHLGLVGMRERALVIGAQIEFESLPGRGTAVRLQWRSQAGT